MSPTPSASAIIRIQGWDRDFSRPTDGTQDLWINDILVQGVVELPAEPQAVELDIRRSAGTFDFSFPSEMGFNYRLEFATSLVGQSVNWQEIDTVPGDGETRSIIDPDPQDAMRIYRILAE